MSSTTTITLAHESYRLYSMTSVYAGVMTDEKMWIRAGLVKTNFVYISVEGYIPGRHYDPTS